MNKIATAEDVQTELRSLLAMTNESKPSRAKLAAAISDLASRVAGGIPQPIKYFIGPHYVQVYSVFETYGRIHDVTDDLTKIEGRLLKIRQEIMHLYQENKGKDPSVTYPNFNDVVVDGVPGGRLKMIVYFNIGMYRMEAVTDAHLAILDKALGRFPEEKPPAF